MQCNVMWNSTNYIYRGSIFCNSGLTCNSELHQWPCTHTENIIFYIRLPAHVKTSFYYIIRFSYLMIFFKNLRCFVSHWQSSTLLESPYLLNVIITCRLHFMHSAWYAETHDQNQWLQVNLSQRVEIRRVATQGRHNSNQWVTSYMLNYSSDGVLFYQYQTNRNQTVSSYLDVVLIPLLLLTLSGVWLSQTPAGSSLAISRILSLK